MFTGIVQAIGTVRSLRQGPRGLHVSLDCPELRRPILPGASVCVSGVCLTVTRSDETLIEFDVVPETLERSTLGSLIPGRRLNLEPSLRVGDPLDGHTVQGHVDGRARVARVESGGRGHVVWLEPDDGLMSYIIPKGSVAVDGVSLTVAAIEGRVFSVALIPTTLKATTLGDLQTADTVNIETDILARTIVTTLQRWRGASDGTELTLETLRQEGYA